MFTEFRSSVSDLIWRLHNVKLWARYGNLVAGSVLMAAALGGAGVAHATTLYATDVTGNFYSVDATTAALTLIGNTGDTLGALEFHPDGTLYGFGIGSVSTLYTIDPSTASATAIGANGEFVFEGGLAFASDGSAFGTNRGTDTTPTLFSLDLGTGAATDIGQISGGNHDIDGLVMRSDGTLVGLDRVSNSLLLINPTTAAATSLAAVPDTVGDVGGLTTIDGSTGYMTYGGALYGVDLFTGASSLIGSNQTILYSLAQADVPEPATLLLFGLGAAGLGFARRRRAAVRTAS